MLIKTITVSFHNFKSQDFKLSVSNPKSKYVAYLSVLSHSSNCQGLGRKNKHEILKTDRTTTTTTTIHNDDNGNSNSNSNNDCSLYIYIYIYIHVSLYTYPYIYIYI